jgi:thiamine pyrophosphate-dependent acetolactate synthase large subunit-like protein
LAHRGTGRIPISFVGDGDLLVCTSSLWTAAHHGIPILYVVFNNRAYHQERMHIQRMANRYGRGVDRTHIGTTIDRPSVDFAKLAQGYGAVGIGPIVDPNDLAAAFRRAVEVVRSGQPVLVDVVSQPR